MNKFEIKKDEFIGVWENINVEPFNYSDNIEITLYLTALLDNSIEILYNNKLKAYFSRDLEIFPKDEGKFVLKFINSALNDNQDLLIECVVFDYFSYKSFIADFPIYGKRCFVLR